MAQLSETIDSADYRYFSTTTKVNALNFQWKLSSGV